MSNNLLSFNRLIDDATHYLDFILQADLRRIGCYRRIWKQAREIIVQKEILHYDEVVEAIILHARYGDKAIGILTSSEYRFRKAMKILTEFSKTGKMTIVSKAPRIKPIFEGPIGQIISNFLDYMIREKGISKHTIRTYELYLSIFYNYCILKGKVSIDEINQKFLIEFITANFQRSINKLGISNLRCLFRYAHEQNLTKINLALKIPIYKRVIQPKIPSVYLKEEVEKLISSIERSTQIGKRSYVIIVLAARLGLRAGDIAGLRFNDIDWTRNTISLKQSKTGKEVILPLLPDVGNAIIDYLKYGRPKSEEPFVLLSARPPFGHFINSNIVTHTVQRALLKAGISIEGRRFGPHALRHSLSFRLLQDSTAISVISEVLGHNSTNTTKKYYLRIDLRSMQPCALEVILISDNFYEQQGGIFYDKTT